MNTQIYFFSATGNSLDVARDVAKEMGEAELIPITAANTTEGVRPTAERIGIIFPVYDWNMPNIIKNFVQSLDLSSVQYIFAAVTCNYLPGMALDMLDSYLGRKGRKLNAGFIIRMPGNFIAFYGANSERTQRKKFGKKRSLVKQIAEIVRNTRDHGIEKSRIIIDRAFASRMGRQMEEFFKMDEKFTCTEKCNGCGICAKVCGFKSIQMENKRPVWQHKCQQCFACIQWCPQEAIQIGVKTVRKKRYRNPQVTLQDIIQSR